MSIKSCCGKPIAFSYRKMPSLCFGICARISDGIIVVFAYIRHRRPLYLEMPEWFCIFVEEVDGLVLCLWSLSYWLLYRVVLIGVSVTLASVRRSLSTYQSLGNYWSLSLDVFSDSRMGDGSYICHSPVGVSIFLPRYLFLHCNVTS